jgi:protein-tyrosine phosphatase
MIDLHCHLLPGVDDGAKDLDSALAMARIAVADGIRTTACTPHIQPGVYDNTPERIRNGVSKLQAAIDKAEIPLTLVVGSDAHIRPDFVAALRAGQIAPLHASRYVLFEPPHHVAPPAMDSVLFDMLANGYVPILTHPERLTWMGQHYEMLKRLVGSGVWLQITAGSLTGRFGRNPQHLAERMLGDGLVHILATDAHSTHRRPPLLREGMEAAARVIGNEEAHHLVVTRPQAVLENRTIFIASKPLVRQEKRGLFANMFAR